MEDLSKELHAILSNMKFTNQEESKKDNLDETPSKLNLFPNFNKPNEVALDKLEETVEKEFGPDGIFKGVEGYKYREGQVEMSKLIAKLICEKEKGSDVNKLIVEAGTGIGKTFAYLIPIFLHRHRAVISTESLALQDQLYFKDIVDLKKLMGMEDIVVSKLKGVNNYLCLAKLKQLCNQADSELIFKFNDEDQSLKENIEFSIKYKSNDGEDGRLTKYSSNLSKEPRIKSKLKNIELSKEDDTLENFDTIDVNIDPLKPKKTPKEHHLSLRELSVIVDFLNNDDYCEIATLGAYFKKCGEIMPEGLDSELSTSSGNCRYNKDSKICKSCIYKFARNRAKKSDILIMNHAIFCYGSDNASEFFPEGLSVCVFDECHKLPNRVRSAFTKSLESESLYMLFNFILKSIEKTSIKPICVNCLDIKDLIIDKVITNFSNWFTEVKQSGNYMFPINKMIAELINSSEYKERVEKLVTAKLQFMEPLGSKINTKIFEAFCYSVSGHLINSLYNQFYKTSTKLGIDFITYAIKHEEEIKKKLHADLDLFFSSLRSEGLSSDKNAVEQDLKAGISFSRGVAHKMFRVWVELLSDQVRSIYDAIKPIENPNKNAFGSKKDENADIEDFLDAGAIDENLYYDNGANFIGSFLCFKDTIKSITAIPNKDEDGQSQGGGVIGFLDSVALDSLEDVYDVVKPLYKDFFGGANFDESRYYRWFFKDKKGNFALNISPYQPGREMHQFILNNGFFQNTSFIFTSATIQVKQVINDRNNAIRQDGFYSFISSLDLNEDKLKAYAFKSPFDYKNHALFCVPREIGENIFKASDKIEILSDTINAAKGGVFYLCTSNAQIELIAKAIRFSKSLKKRKLFVQTPNMNKNEIIKNFTNVGNAILVGTKSFWEGVNVIGDALTLVIIDKIPFPGPSIDCKADERFYTQILNMRSAFNVVSIPRAMIDLYQGVGRLIRSETDKGAIILCAPQLLEGSNKNYRKTFIDAFAHFTQTESLSEVKAFLQKI